MEVHAKTWCCCDQGVSRISSRFQTNTYIPGEDAIIISEVDNTHCRLPVKQVGAQLFRTISLRSNQGKEHVVTELV
jgi:hypothetical protein